MIKKIKLLNSWTTAGIASYFTSFVLVVSGWGRLNNYHQNESLPALNKHVYVGGDAYNYIINTNVLAGYFALAGAFVVAGTLFLIAGRLTLQYKKSEGLCDENIT